MCNHKQKIYNPYLRQHLYVDCGHCPACEQLKANRRSNKIRCHAPSNTIPYFITLTYSNDYIPYFDLNLIHQMMVGNIEDHEPTPFPVPVFRDKSVRFYKNKRIIQSSPQIITSFLMSPSETDNMYFNFNFLQKKHNGKPIDIFGKVGVIYNKDFSNFIKRLRINLSRAGLNNNLSYFRCSEYGPTTQRPHFHSVIWLDKSLSLDQVKYFVCKSWSFEDKDQLLKNIEIAVSPSSYISTYVNSFSNFNPIFKNIFPAKTSHSKGFGLSPIDFSLPKIYSRFIEQQTTTYTFSYRNKDGQEISAPLPLPHYVVRKYFPIEFGFLRLSTDAKLDVMFAPSNIFRYASQYGLSQQNCKNIINNIRRIYAVHQQLYDPFLIVNWINKYKSDLIKLNHENSNHPIYAYDNVNDYFYNPDFLSTIDFRGIEIDDTYIEKNFSPNFIPDNLSRTNKLIQDYHKKIKKRKYNEYCQNIPDAHQ